MTFFGAQVTLFKCGNTHTPMKGKTGDFLRFILKIYKNTVFKITMLSIPYSDFGIIWIIDSECIKLS